MDVVRERLGGPFDAAFANAFIQVLSLTDAAQALSNIHAALRPGGVIHIVNEPLDNSRLTPIGHVLWGPVFHAVYEGRPYTLQEYQDLLSKAGFVDFTLDATGSMRARKP